jgi:Zn-dependent protease
VEYDFYPQKPELLEPKAKGNVALTIFSIVLFILTFLFIFTDEVNFVFNLVIVLIIHELGHFSMMKLFGYKNVRMLFIPLMGAFVQGSKEEYSQKQSLFVVGAGPFPGIIIGVLLMYFAGIYQNGWMVELAVLFLLLNIINLIPLDPLDGGQIFKLLMRSNHDLFILVFTFISSLVLIAFGWFIDSWVMILFGFFMGFRVRTIQNQHQLRKELKEENVNFRTTYKQLTNRDFSVIKQVVLDNTPNLRKFLDSVEPEEADPIIASQVNSVLISPVHQDASLIFKIFVILFWFAALSIPFVIFINFDFFVANYEWWFEVPESR